MSQQVSQLDDHLSFVLWDGVSPVTGKADELGFQGVPSSMAAVIWT